MLQRSEALLVYSGWLHPPYRGVRRVARLTRGHVSSLTTMRVGRCLSNPDWERYRLVILYTHAQCAEEGVIAALEEHVRAGGAVLAIHSATASFKGNRLYGSIVGATFSGHGKYSPVSCFPADEWTRKTVGDSFVVKEELYLHTPAADRTVHLTAENGEPVAWSRRHGKGRVYYLLFGHRPAVFVHPSVQGLVISAIKWLTRAGSEGPQDPVSDDLE